MSLPKAEMKGWKLTPNLTTPSLLEGFVFNDELGINIDGSYARVSNILKVIMTGQWFIVTTDSCEYHLHTLEKAGTAP